MEYCIPITNTYMSEISRKYNSIEIGQNSFPRFYPERPTEMSSYINSFKNKLFKDEIRNWHQIIIK